MKFAVYMLLPVYSFVNVVCQEICSCIDAESGAVDTYVIVSGIAPFIRTIVIVIGFSLLVYPCYRVIGGIMIQIMELHDTAYLGFHIAQNEDLDYTRIFAENVFGASSDSDKGLS